MAASQGALGTADLTAARAALQARDPERALSLLAQAEATRPSLDLYLDKALAQRMLGRLGESLTALDAALAIDPLSFLALLSKGALLERMGRPKDAAVVYARALDVAPEPVAPGLAAPLERAREVVAEHGRRLREHLDAVLAPLRVRHGAEGLARFEESLGVFIERRPVYAQKPLLLHYTRLPAIPFFEREHFPWLERLEAATPMIQQELEAARTAALDDFTPYIAFPPGAPVNQWGELNHSRRWSTFFLWKDGVRQDEACALCPGTAALLESLPMQHQPGFAPTAMFSTLDARTRIPPHTGSANTRLIVHLPLALPGPAAFRVGSETRPWRMGEAWVFDDTIEHEAWNDADEPRTILIFDVWNPLLSEGERELVSAMMTAKNAFQTA